MNNLNKFDFASFCGIESDGQTQDSKYSSKIEIPQYLPSIVCPNIMSLCDTSRYDELVSEIMMSDVQPEIKKFLCLAATRHIVFNYSLIADYYAHANKVVQELMEKSALVIIDIDDAIANGYVKLSKDIEKMLSDSGISAGGTDE